MESRALLESVLGEIRSRGIAMPEGPVRLGRYGDSASSSIELLDLIRAGRKRAGASLLWAYDFEAEPLPGVGDIEIVVDHLDRPAVVTRDVRVEIVPFDGVTAAHAALEGEGDGSLAHWREVHRAFFERECRRIGRRSDERMPVVCCVFEVLHVLSRREDGSDLR